MTDVNAAFAAERAGQIAAAQEASAAWDQRVADGKLVPIGNGQFRVNEPGSWDNGEVFSQVNGIAVPQSGLDVVNGEAQLFTAEPAWHGLGNVVTGVTSVEEVLRLGGIDFRVEQRDVRYAFDGDLRTVPGSKVNVRSDTGNPLGVVGKIYTPFQNEDGAAFLQELISDFGVQFESAGPLDGGRKVFISMRLPEDIKIDAEGVADIVRPYVCWMNSHDGEGKLKVIATPWCPRCANTNRFALRDAVTSWGIRHTKNGLERVEEARRTLGLSLKYFEAFAAEETALARTAFELDEFDKLIAGLWPAADDPSKRQVTLEGRRTDALHASWAVDSKRLGATAYAAEQAVTDYLDHAAPRRAIGTTLAAATATAILEGSSDDIKSKAHKQLMTLRTR